jgi:hypothetical protein
MLLDQEFFRLHGVQAEQQENKLVYMSAPPGCMFQAQAYLDQASLYLFQEWRNKAH